MKVQAAFPEIACFKSDDNSTPYRVFGLNGVGASGKNLLSASWKRSRNEFSGQFNFTIKEDVRLASYSNATKVQPFLDVVQPMDVVTFKGDSASGKADFIGIITDISVSATAGSYQKSISITGKSIEHLLELYCISLDATAMIWSGTQADATALSYNFVENVSNKTDGLPIKDVLQEVYKHFDQVAKSYPGISNVKISEMVNTWMGTDFFECDKDLKFHLPISSNLMADSTIKFPDYIRNLLPQPLYEFYGTVVDGKPKVVCRECPFDAEDWNALETYPMEASCLTNYALTRSNGEVYTAFIPYLEGSALSMNHYQVQASSSGYPHQVIDEQKLAIYGFRPLNCNFVGFKTEGTSEETMTDIFKRLAGRMKSWYSNLDDMYDANFTMVAIKNKALPKLGQKLKFANGQFYLTGLDYSWSYSSSPTIKCQAERGGEYQNGSFARAISGLSRPHVEMLQ